MDGVRDLAVVTNFHVVLMVNRGSFFAPAVVISTFLLSSGHTIVSGDVDRDGRDDLVFTSYDDVYLLRNTFSASTVGDWSYVRTSITVPGMEFFAVDLADLDADGHMDIATAATATSFLFYGDGSANLTTATAKPLNTGWPAIFPSGHWVSAADLTGDGLPELAFCNYHSNGPYGLMIYRNLGARAFVSWHNVTIGQGGSVQLADVDANGWLDVVASGFLYRGVGIMYNRGSGNLSGLVRVGSSSTPDRTVQSFVVDWNMDGWLDVLVLAEGLPMDGGGVYVSFNDRHGSFVNEWQRLDFEAAYIWFVHGEDLNGDDVPDLVYGDFTHQAVFFQAGSCELSACARRTESTSVTLPSADLRSVIPVATTSGGVGHDLVVAHALGASLVSFASLHSLRVDVALADAALVTAGDLGADQAVDLVLITRTGALFVCVHSGVASAPYATAGLSAVPAPPSLAGARPITLELAKLNNDAWPDVVILANTTAAVAKVTIGMGTLGRSFASFATLAAVSPAKQWTCLAVGDVTGDGYDDVLVGATNMSALIGGVFVLANNGTGGFATTLPHSIKFFYARAVVAIALGELDYASPSRLDLVVLDGTGVHTFLNRDNGTFNGSLAGSFAVAGSPQSVANPFPAASSVRVADVNADGQADLIVSGAKWTLVYESGAVAGRSWLPSELLRVETASTPIVARDGLAVGDWNGDGVTDTATLTSALALALTTCRADPRQSEPALSTSGANCESPARGMLANVVTSRLAGRVLGVAVVGTGPVFVSTHARTALAIANSNASGMPMLTRSWAELTSPVTFDRDGDGDLDVAMIAAANRSVIWVQNSAGTFVETGPFSLVFAPTPLVPISLASARPSSAAPDLLVGTSNSVVFVRVMAAGFAPFTLVSGSGKATAVALVDLSGDRVLDAVAALPGGVVLVIAPSELAAGGLASTGPFVTQTLSTRSATSFATGDLDGDGLDDLVTGLTNVASASDARVLLFRSGALDAPIALVSGRSLTGRAAAPVAVSAPTLVAVADVDDDADLDIVFAVTSAEGGAWSLLNYGGGSFPTLALLSLAANVSCVALGDVDANGRVDVVLGRADESESLAVLLNTIGPARFSRPDVFSSVTGGMHLFDVQVLELVDFDDDGDLDIVWGSMDGMGFGWVENVDGRLSTRRARAFVPGLGVNSLAVGLLNNDSTLDVAVCTFSAASQLSVYTASPNRSHFNLAWTLALASPCERIRLVDWTGSGALSIIVASFSSGEFFFFNNTGGPQATVVAFAQTGTVAYFYETANDVICMNGALVTTRLLDRCFFATSVSLREVRFAVMPYEGSAITTAHSASSFFSISAANLNGDAYPDVVAVTAATGVRTLIVMLNGGGVFGFPVVVDASADADSDLFEQVVADFDSDGLDDVLFAARHTCKILLYMRGQFQRVDKIAACAGGGIATVAAGDVDGDGDLDFVTQTSITASVQGLFLYRQSNAGVMFPSAGYVARTRATVATSGCGYTVSCLLARLAAGTPPETCLAALRVVRVPAGVYRGCFADAAQLLDGGAFALTPDSAAGDRVIIDCGDNSGYAFALGADTRLSLVNVTVRNTGPTAAAIELAGDDAALELTGVDIVNGTGGGIAVRATRGAVVFRSGAIHSCHAADVGGGIAITGASARVTLGAVSVTNCSARGLGGGGIALVGPGASLKLSAMGTGAALIAGNRALSGAGGGILVAGTAYAVLAGVTITANTAARGGGFAAIANAAAPLRGPSRADLLCTGALRDGGARPALTLRRSTVYKCSAASVGGAGLVCGSVVALVEGSDVADGVAPRGSGLFFCRPGGIESSVCARAGDCCNVASVPARSHGAPWLVVDGASSVGPRATLDAFGGIADETDGVAFVASALANVTVAVNATLDSLDLSISLRNWFGDALTGSSAASGVGGTSQLTGGVLSIAASTTTVQLVDTTNSAAAVRASATTGVLLVEQPSAPSTPRMFMLSPLASLVFQPTDIGRALDVASLDFSLELTTPIGSTAVSLALAVAPRVPEAVNPVDPDEPAASLGSLKSPSSTASLALYLLVALLLWVAVASGMMRKRIRARYLAAPEKWRLVELHEAVLYDHPLLGVLFWQRGDPFHRGGRVLALVLHACNVFVAAAALDLRPASSSGSGLSKGFNLASALTSLVIACLGTMIGLAVGLPLVRAGLTARAKRTRAVALVGGIALVGLFVGLCALLLQMRVWLRGGAMRARVVTTFWATSMAIGLGVIAPARSLLMFFVFGLNYRPHLGRSGAAAEVEPENDKDDAHVEASAIDVANPNAADGDETTCALMDGPADGQPHESATDPSALIASASLKPPQSGADSGPTLPIAPVRPSASVRTNSRVTPGAPRVSAAGESSGAQQRRRASSGGSRAAA